MTRLRSARRSASPLTRVHEMHALAKSLWRRGFRNASYAANVVGVSKRTMRLYFAKLRAGASLEARPRSGRPPKLTPRLRRSIAQIKKRHPFESASFYAANIKHATGVVLSVRSARRLLHQLGYAFVKTKRRSLTSAQKRERVSFATAHLADCWDDRWSFDESTFNLYRLGKRCWVRVSPKDGELEPSLGKQSRKVEKVSVSVVGAITRGRMSALGFLPRNWSAGQLVEVVERDIYPSLRWVVRGRRANELMCDNDGRHHTHVWRDYVARSQLRPLDPWASNGPDLNPIEHVWAWMKDYVEALQPASEHALREAIRAAWRDFPLAAH